MLRFFYLLTLLFSLIACNKYEITHLNSVLHITVVDEKTQTPFANQELTLRTSNFRYAVDSECFYEDSTTVSITRAISDINGDCSFEIPFIDGRPQEYYEISLTQSNRSIKRSSFIEEYEQEDRFEIGDFIPVEVIITQDSNSVFSLATYGYSSKEALDEDCKDGKIRPHDVTRMGFAYGPVDTVTTLLSYNQNKVFYLLLIDRNTDRPIVFSEKIIRPEKDSTVRERIKIR